MFWYVESALEILRSSHKNETVFLRMIFENNSINKKTFFTSSKNYLLHTAQSRRKLQICLHLLKKSVMENFIFVKWQMYSRNILVVIEQLLFTVSIFTR